MLFRLKMTKKFIDESTHEYMFEDYSYLQHNRRHFLLFAKPELITFLHRPSEEELKTIIKAGENIRKIAEIKRINEPLYYCFERELSELDLFLESGVVYELDKNKHVPTLTDGCYSMWLFGYHGDNGYYFCLPYKVEGALVVETITIFNDSQIEKTLKSLFDFLVMNGYAIKEEYNPIEYDSIYDSVF